MSVFDKEHSLSCCYSIKLEAMRRVQLHNLNPEWFIDFYKPVCRKKRIETLARDIFTQVGNTLQQRRMDDFTNTFGSHLTDRFK